VDGPTPSLRTGPHTRSPADRREQIRTTSIRSGVSTRPGAGPLSSLDESGPFSVSLGHLCACLSYAVEPPRTPSMAKRKLGSTMP